MATAALLALKDLLEELGLLIGTGPTASPFFKDEQPTDATARLRSLFETDSQFSQALLNMQQKNASRRSICFGIGLIEHVTQPVLGAWNVDDVVPIDSLAKIAVLYAAYQLHNDVALWGKSVDVSGAGTVDQMVQQFQALIASRFQTALDPALQKIARNPSQMPRLSRLFDLKSFVQLTQDQRDIKTLQFTTGDEPPPYTDDLLTRIDHWSTDRRLNEMMQASSNEAACSLIADIGLPYITALLERSGIAFLAIRKGGLWLSSNFHSNTWPVRQPPAPPPITAIPPPVYITRDAAGDDNLKKGSPSTQAGSVLGVATFMMMLQKGWLVSGWASNEMINRFATGGRIAGTTPQLPWIKNDIQGVARQKVGINGDYTRLSEAVLLTTQTSGGSSDAGNAPKPSNNPQTWCAVALNVSNTPQSPEDSSGADATMQGLGVEAEQQINILADRIESQ